MAKKPALLVVGLALLGLSGGAAVAAHLDARRRFNGNAFGGVARRPAVAGYRSSDGYDQSRGRSDDTPFWMTPFIMLGVLDDPSTSRDDDSRNYDAAPSYDSSSSYDSGSSYSSSYSDSGSSSSSDGGGGGGGGD